MQRVTRDDFRSRSFENRNYLGNTVDFNKNFIIFIIDVIARVELIYFNIHISESVFEIRALRLI